MVVLVDADDGEMSEKERQIVGLEAEGEPVDSTVLCTNTEISIATGPTSELIASLALRLCG